MNCPPAKSSAKPSWRERDRGQYLWAIGHGRFILRIRNSLSLLDPLAKLAENKPFEQQPFVDLHRTIGYIAVSAPQDLISIETTAPKSPEARSPEESASSSSSSASASGLHTRTGPPPSQDIQINFYRTIYETVSSTGQHAVADPRGARLTLQSSGVVLAPNLIDIPATSDGYLDISRESAGVFLFDFQGHGGKRIELSPFETSCVPRPHFVSPTEFIAFGCRGSDDRQEMAGFNLHGEEPWINAFSNHHLFPYLVSAPAAGRFALSRTITAGSYIDVDNLTIDQVAAQEVTVHQAWDGRAVFKLAATPFQRSGQNFDLSADGQTLAIIHDGKIQTYKLPALSHKDEDALKIAATWTPEHTEARISLGGKPVRKNSRPEEKVAAQANVTAQPEAATGGVESETKPQPAAPATSQVAATPVQSQSGASSAAVQEPNQTVNGDLDPTQHRPPPTLYDPAHPRQKGDAKPSVEAGPR